MIDPRYIGEKLRPEDLHMPEYNWSIMRDNLLGLVMREKREKRPDRYTRWELADCNSYYDLPKRFQDEADKIIAEYNAGK